MVDTLTGERRYIGNVIDITIITERRAMCERSVLSVRLQQRFTDSYI